MLTINCLYRVSHVRILIIWHLLRYFHTFRRFRVAYFIYGRHSWVWPVVFRHRHIFVLCAVMTLTSWVMSAVLGLRPGKLGQMCGLWSHSISPIGISSYFQRGPFTVPGDQNVVHTPSSHSPKSCLIFGGNFHDVSSRLQALQWSNGSEVYL